jgi:hypothetical protein
MLLPASTNGKGLTVIVTLSVAEQPFPSVPTTVYVDVDVALDVGFEMVALSSDPAGDQE